MRRKKDLKEVENVKKKVGSLLLAVVMIVTALPVFGTKVHAAELPDSTQYATVDELKAFNTNDQDGENPAKVYFGNNNQQWWIAGTQHNNLILFAADVLDKGIPFELDVSNDKGDITEWEDCTYVDGVSPQSVYPSHYGASDIRKMLKGLETSYFTNSEQQLMNDTLIYTYDEKNGKAYSVSDKLYLAHGDRSATQYLTVGANGFDNLNSGLRIDKGYWGAKTDPVFWLRATPPKNITANITALEAWPTARIINNKVSNGDKRGVKPAFELNLSSVIFASAVPAVASDGNLSINDAFTLRHSANNLGSALVVYDKSKVILTNVPNGTYLVVQNSDGAKAKQITNETEVSANDMNLDSFANCQVWLETTDTANRMTYAILATEGQVYDVNVVGNDGLTVTNGTQGVAQGTAISDIIVEVANGYYLPDDYSDSIQGLNGLSVTNMTKNSFTISGTPTGDVNITLPAAAVLSKDDIPQVELNHVPTINASDKILTVGDEFDPLKDVTASDKEDGDITRKVEVLSNDVDVLRAGTYAVTYRVTDSKGASSKKTITVTVKGKDTQKPTIDDNKKPPITDTDKNPVSPDKQITANNPKTGDSTNMITWVVLMFVSFGMLSGVFAVRKSRKSV